MPSNFGCSYISVQTGICGHEHMHEQENYILFCISKVININTLRTGDADLRF